MITKNLYKAFAEALNLKTKLLAVLVDPDKFEVEEAPQFIRTLPVETSHIFVGGSSVPKGATDTLVRAFKMVTSKPIIIFPGDHSQISEAADALLFLNLLSGRNPEYLAEQQVKSVPVLRNGSLEVIPTAYLLIDGGRQSAVERVTMTSAMPQDRIMEIVDTAKAGEFMGAKLIYLEAGSGARFPVSEEIISAVKKEISIPLLVGGGIRTNAQRQSAYEAGADMVVMGTAFEENPS